MLFSYTYSYTRGWLSCVGASNLSSMLATRLWSVVQCCLKGILGACAMRRKSLGAAPGWLTCGDYSILGWSSIMPSIADKASSSLLSAVIWPGVAASVDYALVGESFSSSRGFLLVLTSELLGEACSGFCMCRLRGCSCCEQWLHRVPSMVVVFGFCESLFCSWLSSELLSTQLEQLQLDSVG